MIFFFRTVNPDYPYRMQNKISENKKARDISDNGRLK
jgi:hypothetical protein